MTEPRTHNTSGRAGGTDTAGDAKIRRFRAGRDLPPFLIAALILAYVLHGRDWTEIELAMRHADLRLFFLGAAVFIAAHFLSNCISYYQMYNWFLVKISFKETSKAFGATVLFQTVVTALGQAVFYLYLIRKKKLKVLPVVGVSFFYIFNDLYVMLAILITALLLQPDLGCWVYIWLALLAPAMAFATWYFPGRGGMHFLTRIYSSDLAISLRNARPVHYAKFLPVRLVYPLFQFAGHMIALHAMGINAPFSAVIVITTLMTFTTFMPVSALGMGAPNLVALAFMPYVADPAVAGEVAAAYGLLFQTCFLVGRLVIGAAFALPFWREVVKESKE
ncbi:MAG TPA: hypothetical protein VM658_09355 [bacterium]|nr:hypothetical protein [bacterium]